MADPMPSALAFAEALKHPEYGPKIRARIHRVSRSRFVHGQRRPDLDTAKWLEDVTEGAVPMTGWSEGLSPLADNDAADEVA